MSDDLATRLINLIVGDDVETKTRLRHTVLNNFLADFGFTDSQDACAISGRANNAALNKTLCSFITSSLC